jgi:hypothetical protein
MEPGNPVFLYRIDKETQQKYYFHSGYISNLPERVEFNWVGDFSQAKVFYEGESELLTLLDLLNAYGHSDIQQMRAVG